MGYARELKISPNWGTSGTLTTEWLDGHVPCTIDQEILSDGVNNYEKFQASPTPPGRCRFPASRSIGMQRGRDEHQQQ